VVDEARSAESHGVGRGPVTPPIAVARLRASATLRFSRARFLRRLEAIVQVSRFAAVYYRSESHLNSKSQ